MKTHKIRDGSAWAQRLWRERRPMVLSAVLLGFGLPVVIGLAQLSKHEPAPVQELTKLPQVVEDVQNLRLSGDTMAADKKIQGALNDPSLNGTTRAALYIQKGNILQGKKDFQGAIEAYKLADQTVHSYSVAWLLGDVYRTIDNKTQAVVYYKKAVERAPKGEPLAAAEREYLQHLIQELEAGRSP